MALTRVTKTGNITVDGDIGIGVVPGEWSVNYPAFQIGQGGTFTGHRNNTQTQLGQNWWVGTGNQYVVNGAASRMIMNPDSTIIFSQAPSGTAGATMSTTYNRLVIDTSGAVTKPNHPAFLAVGNSGQTSYSAGAIILIVNQQFDKNNNFNTTNGRFTAPVDGVYMFTYGFYSYESAKQFAIKVNNSDYAPSDTCGLVDAKNTGDMCNGSLVLDLSANDYVNVGYRSGNTGSVYLNHCWFGGHLIG